MKLEYILRYVRLNGLDAGLNFGPFQGAWRIGSSMSGRVGDALYD